MISFIQPRTGEERSSHRIEGTDAATGNWKGGGFHFMIITQHHLFVVRAGAQRE
jgi:hypothetical protein